MLGATCTAKDQQGCGGAAPFKRRSRNAKGLGQGRQANHGWGQVRNLDRPTPKLLLDPTLLPLHSAPFCCACHVQVHRVTANKTHSTRAFLSEGWGGWSGAETSGSRHKKAVLLTPRRAELDSGNSPAEAPTPAAESDGTDPHTTPVVTGAAVPPQTGTGHRGHCILLQARARSSAPAARP